jgi:putative phosphoesterase
MKLLLFSDSHGNVSNMVKVIKKQKDIDLIIHLGDMLKDVNELIKNYNYYNIEYVRGNNDWGLDIPDYKILNLESKRIFITHGHRYNVKSEYGRIARMGHSVEADAVFFGHTHDPEEFFDDNMMVLNPGSIAGGRYALRATYCIINIEDGKIKSRFESIKK